MGTCNDLRVIAREAERHEASGLLAHDVDAGRVDLRCARERGLSENFGRGAASLDTGGECWRWKVARLQKAAEMRTVMLLRTAVRTLERY